MATATDIVGYSWQADLFCPTCIARMMSGTGATAEDVLDDAAKPERVDRTDESTFDSDSFPKVVFRDQVGQDDTCGYCGEMLSETYPTGTDPLPGGERP